MISKKVIIIAIFLFFLIFVFYLLSAKPKLPSRIIPRPSKSVKEERFFPENGTKMGGLPLATPVQLNDSQVIEKVLAWMNSMKDQNNLYFANIQCNSEKQCSNPVTDKQLGIIAMWAHYIFYKKSNKAEELAVVKNHIASYANEVYQPDFWHCRFLYEIASEPSWSQNEKNQLKKICDDSLYYKYHNAVKNALNNLEFNSNYFINAMKTTNKTILYTEIGPLNEQEALMFSTYASDFIAKYRWTNIPQHLFVAKNYFDAALSYYLSHKSDNNVYLPYLGLAALDIYKVTSNENYLNFAKFIAEQVANMNIDNLSTKISLSYLKRELFINTKDKIYLNWSSTKTDLLDNYFDFLNYKGYRLNKESFHNRGFTTYNYDVRQNALIVGLFSLP
ncbi:MAG: hypothetical protein QHH09_03935 [Microgenomates group bacterium]|nr:hypothetical protein [Microgenomates group bacterium]